jgi:hypothetical protein
MLLMLLQGAVLPAPAVRDSIAAVFRQPAYDRSLARSLWSRIAETLARWAAQAFDAFQRSPALTRTVLVLAVLIVLLFCARLAYVAYLERGRGASLGGLGTRGGARRGDPWEAAQRLAARGEYTEAAHLLYAALLEAVARRERIRLHPSKTVGDYTRELRRQASPLWPPFRDFARVYEVVVYGIGTCDRERWERLDGMARTMITARAA